MIKRTSSWQLQLSEAISDPAVLCEMLELDSQTVEGIDLSIQQFPLRVPHAFVSRMEKGNPNDPLLRQVLPMGIEMQSVQGFVQDPLHEDRYSPVPGLLHKYQGRVLLTLTGACAINCRYCFRRYYPYSEKVPGLSQWQPAFDYIAKNESISEVILSGGEPLLVKDSALSLFLKKLEAIPHLKVVRFHTRLPIVIPDRVTDEFVQLLEETRLKVVIILHSNHANELDASVQAAVEKCRRFVLLNQAVLLKGVNDSESALINLSRRLSDVNVLPYYLHLLDPVAGTSHFNVSEACGKALINKISAQLPGYLVPRLVREVPGRLSKEMVRH